MKFCTESVVILILFIWDFFRILNPYVVDKVPKWHTDCEINISFAYKRKVFLSINLHSHGDTGIRDGYCVCMSWMDKDKSNVNDSCSSIESSLQMYFNKINLIEKCKTLESFFFYIFNLFYYCFLFYFL